MSFLSSRCHLEARDLRQVIEACVEIGERTIQAMRRGVQAPAHRRIETNRVYEELLREHLHLGRPDRAICSTRRASN